MTDTTRLELLCAARLVGPGHSRWTKTYLDISALSRNGDINVAARLYGDGYEVRGVSWSFSRKARNELEALATVRQIAERPAEALPLGRFSGPENLCDLLRGRVANLGMATLLDTTQGAAELADGAVGIGLGRHLVAELERGAALTPALLEGIAHYCSLAPFVFGYWAPFKRLVKLLESEPAALTVLPVALARIDGALRLAPKGPKAPDLRSLIPHRQGEIASPETLAYLARRGRRWLRRLGRGDPAAYVRAAEAFLIAADYPAAHARASSRLMLAEVIYGHVAKDTGHGRGGVSLPIMESRMGRRADRYPEAWNAHPDAVRRVWQHIAHEPEIQAWAFNVLRDRLHAVPALRGAALALALLSPAAQVRAQACEQIAENPAPLFALGAGSIVAFLSFSTARQFAAVRPTLEARATDKAVGDAVLQVLSVQGLPELRRGMDLTIDSRTGTLLQFALRSLGPRLNAAETYLIAQHVGRSTGFKPLRLWQETLAGLPLKILIELRLRLPDLPAAVVRVIDTACLDNAHGAAGEPHAAYALLSSPAATLRALGWSMIAHADNPAIERAWSSLIDNADTPAGLACLREALGRRHGAARLVRLLECDGSAELLAGLALAIGAHDPRLVARLSRKLATKRDSALTVRTLAQLAEGVGETERAPWARLLWHCAKVDPDLPSALWSSITAEASPTLQSLCLASPALTGLVLGSVEPDSLSIGGTGVAAKVELALRAAPSRLYRDAGFALACAACPHPSLQAFALARLHSRQLIAPLYLALAESGLPAPLATAERYVSALRDPAALTAAVIALCDSGTRPARALGLALIERCAARLDWHALLNALAEHTAPEIVGLVARRAAEPGALRVDTRARFEGRVLKTRRAGRRAKELVKQRLEAGPMIAGSLGTTEDSHIDALLALARGTTLRDRDWALRRLAQLAMEGHPIPELTISRTT